MSALVALLSAPVGLCVSACVCSRVIFSMALPHKIFTWPSIMDCDLIEAECSHRVPSVNSPHRFFFFPFFRKTRCNLIFGPNSKLTQDFKNMLLAFETSGTCLFYLFICSWQTSVNMLSTSQTAAASSNPPRYSSSLLYRRMRVQSFETTKHTMPTAFFSSSFFPPSTTSWQSFSFKLYSLLNWTAKSQSEPDSVNPHVAVVGRLEGLVWGLV